MRKGSFTKEVLCRVFGCMAGGFSMLKEDICGKSLCGLGKSTAYARVLAATHGADASEVLSPVY